ncbi:MAG: hypothetical protein LBS19_09885, partial [Clostridiales bacterium]|nr:hypothetical protein [Clostridiales bacterium]
MMDYYVTSAIIGTATLCIPLLVMLASYYFTLRKIGRTDAAAFKTPHIVAACVFCISLIPVLSVTSIPDFTRFTLNVDVNLIPFYNAHLNIEQYLMNIALFIPFGFLL